jgi:hypothetical protein
MERKEPVMAPSVSALEERIPLTWREVNELASVSAPEAKPEPVEASPVSAPVAVAPAPAEERRTLSEEEIAALCDHLTPVLEKTVREALSQTLEMTLHNALMRVRSDLDRSIQPMVRQALERELRADILSQVLKRKGEAPQ